MPPVRWRVIATAMSGDSFDARDEVTRLHLYADDFCLGPSTRAILAAARRRNIPARRLNRFSLVQLGVGARQRRILTAETDRTSAIAETIAQDKELTKNLLAAVGAPVPRGRLAVSAADAWEAALEVGLPVVVKPRNANHGRGVSINLNTRSQVEIAFAHARAEGDGVIVEQFARGAEHRLLVVQKRVVAATRGEPDQIVGDGQHTIAALVGQLNKDPRRGKHYAFAFSNVDLDPAAILTLEEQGYQPESIPPSGAVVVIHRNGEMTTDETDEVHPQVAALAVLAAETVGLDIAGVDMLAPDIGRPLEEQGGVILEVNARPGLLMHLAPERGKPRAVGEMIVDSMFPPGESGRAPTVVVADGEDSAIGSLVARVLRSAGFFVGQATAGGAAINLNPLAVVADSLGRRTDDLSTHPWLTALVVELEAGSLRDEGMPIEHCDLAVLGRAFCAGRDAMGAADAVLPASNGSPESSDDSDLYHRVVTSAVLPEGWSVAWVDDPTAGATRASASSRIVWLSESSADPRLESVLIAGASAVYVAEGAVQRVEHGRRHALEIDRRQLDRAIARWGLAAVLPTIAVAWRLGLADATLADALQSDPRSDDLSQGPTGAATGRVCDSLYASRG